MFGPCHLNGQMGQGSTPPLAVKRDSYIALFACLTLTSMDRSAQRVFVQVREDSTSSRPSGAAAHLLDVERQHLHAWPARQNTFRFL